jgi:hypothetical protein
MEFNFLIILYFRYDYCNSSSIFYNVHEEIFSSIQLEVYGATRYRLTLHLRYDW